MTEEKKVEKRDGYLDNAIKYLQRLGDEKGYMICISVLDTEDRSKLNHFVALGSEFKDGDVDPSLEEQKKNLKNLVDGRTREQVSGNAGKVGTEKEVDLSQKEGELPVEPVEGKIVAAEDKIEI